MVKPTVISLFAGCGGSTLGYKMAGFNELLAIDWDDNAEATYKLNFNSPYYNGDITKLTSDDILKLAKIKKGELDLLDGSPPCQGFSTSGNRKIMDIRNNLFYDFVRLVKELQPKVFVMENVTGQTKGVMKGVFNEILKELKTTGYNFKVKKLNSANYGVPQIRERIFYIGVRPDLKKEPVFPKPKGKPVSVRQAFKGLNGNGTRLSRNIPKPVVKRLQFMRPGEGASAYHKKGSLFNWRRISWNKPSNTIMTTPCLLHPFKDRFLTIEEIKRLCSFPDDFELAGTPEDQWARMGNAVMPLQMKAIAETIKKEILW